MNEIKTSMVDGSPVTEDHRDLQENGQQKGYVVLTEAERAKGFIRPVRSSYLHVGARPKHPTRNLTEEEKERHGEKSFAIYEEYPKSDNSAVGRFWTQKELDSGCGSLTTMGVALSETYARQPDFYSATFCCGCGTHFPVKEFIWDGTNEIVGS